MTGRSSIIMSSALVVVLSLGTAAADLSESLEKGTPELKSAGPIAFGPDGVLFVADPWGAAVFAIDSGDKGPAVKGEFSVEKIDAKVAALLGTTASEIEIQDLAVNPASGNAYLSVARGRGPDAKPALVKVARDGKLSLVELKGVKFARTELPDAPSPEAEGRGGRLRAESITDVAFVDGRVLVAGLSNEEFASTLRSIPYPFKADAKGASVEIYHGAHGAFETRSPVRTFTSFDIGGEPHVLAAYTCTPLVKFPLKELKPGSHVKGTTIAELGNRNRPLDMIVYKKDGKDFILLANNNRGIMKITTEDIDSAGPILARVEGGGPEGLSYETIEGWEGIHQLDRLDDGHALVMRRDDDGAFHLESRRLP